MSNIERYGKRDLTYSKWHRDQGRLLAYIDLDSVEYCQMCKQPITLIELAQDVGQKHKPTTVMCNLARLANLPAYLTFYKHENGEMVSFRVRQVYPRSEEETIMTPTEYREFLCQIRESHPCYKWNDPREKK